MTGIFVRWVFAFLLLSVTFNPTQLNYVQWARSSYTQELPLTVFFGLLLLIGYIIYLRATLRSIGAAGMFLVAALVGTMVWVLIDWGVLTLENSHFNLWLGIFAMSVVLGIGLSWSMVRRHLSGQIDMDDIDQ
ncbi:hypothetical protein ATO10_11167 [Actibacterium atlanticum]|uniref:Uncharacterized protein n=1 Tax=Actibacterium atlanticum TaxID=1461693 RepID=A0A058ZIR8_9RHOB|nr:DUF6524 family protein [Actibacterium atlanticum]KCV81468.1 hypothetical protein ATO10_11167 [Actibacterium atlanticum]